MGIELPPELADAAAAAGVRWPDADEDRMREAAQAWRDAGTRMSALTGEADSTAHTALSTIEGDTADAAGRHWSTFVRPDSGHLTETVTGCAAAADRLERAADQIGAAKVEIVRHLVDLAKNTDAAHTAAAAGNPNALLGLDTAVRGTAANVANIHNTLVSSVHAGGADIHTVNDVVNANPGVHSGQSGVDSGAGVSPVDRLTGNVTGGHGGGLLSPVDKSAGGVLDTVGHGPVDQQGKMVGTGGRVGDGSGGLLGPVDQLVGGVVDTAGQVTGHGGPVGQSAGGRVDAAGQVVGHGGLPGPVDEVAGGVLDTAGQVTGHGHGGVLGPADQLAGGLLDTAGQVAGHGGVLGPVDQLAGGVLDTAGQVTGHGHGGSGGLLGPVDQLAGGVVDTAGQVTGHGGSGGLLGTAGQGHGGLLGPVDQPAGGVLDTAGQVTGHGGSGGVLGPVDRLAGGVLDTAGQVTGHGHGSGGLLGPVDQLAGGVVDAAGQVTGHGHVLGPVDQMPGNVLDAAGQVTGHGHGGVLGPVDQLAGDLPGHGGHAGNVVDTAGQVTGGPVDQQAGQVIDTAGHAGHVLDNVAHLPTPPAGMPVNSVQAASAAVLDAPGQTLGAQPALAQPVTSTPTGAPLNAPAGQVLGGSPSISGPTGGSPLSAPAPGGAPAGARPTPGGLGQGPAGGQGSSQGSTGQQPGSKTAGQTGTPAKSDTPAPGKHTGADPRATDIRAADPRADQPTHQPDQARRPDDQAAGFVVAPIAGTLLGSDNADTTAPRSIDPKPERKTGQQTPDQPTPPLPPAAAQRTRPTDPAVALFLVHMFPIGHLPTAASRPARQLPPPPDELDYAAGLRFAPGDHPDSALVDSADSDDEAAASDPDACEPVDVNPASAPEPGVGVDTGGSAAAVPLDLLEGYDPLGGEHERDWDRRFLVRPFDPNSTQRAEYAWPPGEIYPEGGTAQGEPLLLPPDSTLDRFGTPDGRVFSADATLFTRRSLPPVHATAGYRRYRVRRDLPVWRAVSAPWFGQPGGGERYRTTHSAAELVALGFLEEL